MGIDTEVTVATHESDLRGIGMMMNMDTTTIILNDKTVTTAFLVDSLMTFEMDTRLPLTVEILIVIMTAMDDQRVDTQNLIPITIMAVGSLSLLAQETGLLRAPIPPMLHRQVPCAVSFEGGEALVLLHGIIRIEIRMGHHRGVVYLHHVTIVVTIGKETMDDIPVALVGMIDLDLRDKPYGENQTRVAPILVQFNA